MSLGLTLSQLLSTRAEPISTGFAALDAALDHGLQAQDIYEVYGPPGVGKTRFGLDIARSVTRTGGRVLWVETWKALPKKLARGSHEEEEQHLQLLDLVRIKRFTELYYFVQRHLLRADGSRTEESSSTYSLIVIDGFSQLLTAHLDALSRRGSLPSGNPALHSAKCRHLLLLLTALRRCARTHNGVVLLLNDTMNSAYQLDAWEDTFVADPGQFLLRSVASRPQTLRSALVANVALGRRDSSWQRLLRASIGLFWDLMGNYDEHIAMQRDPKSSPATTNTPTPQLKALLHLPTRDSRDSNAQHWLALGHSNQGKGHRLNIITDDSNKHNNNIIKSHDDEIVPDSETEED